MMGKHSNEIKPLILYIAIAVLAVIAIISGIFAFRGWTVPYAVTSEGEKVEQPWVVQAGGQDLFLVESESDGAAIVAQVKEYYSKGVENLQDVTVEPEISIVQKDLERGENTPEIIAPESAVQEVIMKDNSDTPILTVTTVENEESIKPVKYKTVYEKTDALYEGELNIKNKGKNGEKVITRQIIKVNGDIVKQEVIGEEITKKPIAKVIEKGTLEIPPPVDISQDAEDDQAEPNEPTEEKSRNNSSEKKTESSGDNDKKSSEKSQTPSEDNDSEEKKPDRTENTDASGKEVAAYACKFIGNPYRYGGSSLTKGADCSGFVMSVYKHFGISLPHSSRAQAGYGRAVSYKNAKPGDIICYPGHVGIYIGKGRIVHASTPSSGIKVSPATYRSITTVRRILE